LTRGSVRRRFQYVSPIRAVEGWANNVIEHVASTGRFKHIPTTRYLNWSGRRRFYWWG
jgi:hypothetical protein